MLKSGARARTSGSVTMPCQQCLRDLEPGEPVFRSFKGRPRRPLTVEFFCESCARDVGYPWGWEDERDSFWREKLCSICGRPVFHLRGFAPPSVHVCGPACQHEHVMRLQRERRGRAGPRDCMVCGRAFTPRRRDARICSNACRQKAHRIKVRVEP